MIASSLPIKVAKSNLLMKKKDFKLALFFYSFFLRGFHYFCGCSQYENNVSKKGKNSKIIVLILIIFQFMAQVIVKKI